VRLAHPANPSWSNVPMRIPAAYWAAGRVNVEV
jgi:hypothetical protein